VVCVYVCGVCVCVCVCVYVCGVSVCVYVDVVCVCMCVVCVYVCVCVVCVCVCVWCECMCVCVCVALGIQHAMRIRRIICGLPHSTTFFPHYLINGTIFERKKKRFLNIKCVLLVSLQILTEIISF